VLQAYATHAEGAQLTADDVDGEKVVFVEYDARKIFVYTPKPPISAPGLPLITY